jgi:hypothetical protein
LIVQKQVFTRTEEEAFLNRFVGLSKTKPDLTQLFSIPCAGSIKMISSSKIKFVCKTRKLLGLGKSKQPKSKPHLFGLIFGKVFFQNLQQ